MKTLHSIQPALVQPVWLFGPGFPCLDARHENERQQTNDYGHDQCFVASLHLAPDERRGDIWLCECTACGRTGRTQHMFREVQPVNWRTERGRDYQCLNCYQGIHPPFIAGIPPCTHDWNSWGTCRGCGQYDINADRGGAHEHEWNDEGECPECGDYNEEFDTREPLHE